MRAENVRVMQSAISATTFEATRGRLFGLAYRMLGSRADAEDIVQEAYVRWHEADKNRIESSEAWLVTTTTRLAIDRLRRLKTEREAYFGPWLPQPIVSDAPPDRHLDLADDLSIAFLTLLERLAPEERAAFLLHDVFDCSFSEVARALDRSEAACRQLASRARTHVRDARPRDESVARDREDDSATRHEELVSAFVDAARAGDVNALMSMLAEDARFVSDGGGKVQAALNVIHGADRVTRFVVGVTTKGLAEVTTLRFGPVNGLPGLIVYSTDGSVQTVAFEIQDNRIRTIYTVRNPDKLRHLASA